jgi:hypothetical protein
MLWTGHLVSLWDEDRGGFKAIGLVGGAERAGLAWCKHIPGRGVVMRERGRMEGMPGMGRLAWSCGGHDVCCALSLGELERKPVTRTLLLV